MRKKKMRAARIVSMLLAVTMVLTSLPQSMMSVSAAEIVSEDTVSSDTQKEGEVTGNTQDGAVSDEETPESGDAKESNPDEDASNDAKSDDETGVQDDNPGSETSEDDKSDEEGSEGNEESGKNTEPETEDGLSEGEEEDDAVSADTEIEDEAEPDMLEEERYISLHFKSYNYEDFEKYKILDSEDEPIGGEIPIQYGSTETIRFKVVPNEGYVITKLSVQDKAARLSKTEDGGGYNCEITPLKMGMVYDRDIVVEVTVREKQNHNLTFIYAGENVEELAVTNGTVQHQPLSNVAIQTTNESSTSFKLKMKDDKAPAVIEEPAGNTDDENKFYLTPDEISDGYYCYDLGKVLEDTIITIEDGWRVSFTYNEDRIYYLQRCIIIGDEADIGLGDYEAEICEVGEIGHEVFVAKGEPLYFIIERDECLAALSVVDGDGKPCKRLTDFEEFTLCYKVVPQADMDIYIEEIPKEIPVSYVEGTVKNISVSSAEDEGIAYDPEKKKIVNIYNEAECNISFELEDKENKPLRSVMAVRHYDDGYESYTEYDAIEVEANADGVYTGTFYIGYDFAEIRIIAGESHTIDFEISDGINVYDSAEEPIETGSSREVTNGAEYNLRMHMKEGYGLATPSVVATIGEETRELEVKRVSNYDEVSYHVSIIPRAGMSIKISAVPKSIPLKYAEGAIKDIAAEKLSLSEDKKNININSYYELTEGRITFVPETGKTVTRAYYEFTMPVYDDDDRKIGTKTYTESIPLSYDENTNTYTLSGISFIEDITDYMDLDGIYLIAGDTSELMFDIPGGKASIYSFNNYKYDYENGALTSPVNAAQNQEYLFGVKLSDDFDAATYSVTAGDSQEELAVKYFIRSMGMWEEEEITAYYGYTPTSAAETIHINVNPQSIPVKYEADAVESLKLVNAETANKPEFKDNKALLWSYNTVLKFELKLKSGKKLSRIFSRHAEDNATGSIEQEIQFKLNEDNSCYEFEIGNDSRDLLEIEIVTDKISLLSCTPKLMLDNEEIDRTEDESNEYHVSYMAREIRPEVVLTYNDETSDTETILSADKYDVSYENNRNAGIAAVIVKAKEDSGCTGSQKILFRIDKADAPTIENYNIYTAAGDAVNMNNNNRTMNLSKRFNVSTTLNEEGVEPIEYSYVSHIPGSVLADEDASGESSIPSVTPVYAGIKDYWGEGTGELLYYVLNYSVAADAAEESGTATIVLNAEFENYNSAQVTIEVAVKEKTELRFGMEKPSNKTYDGEAYSYDIENLYVVGEYGEKLVNSDEIMAEIESDIRLRYIGYAWMGKISVDYDSYEAPVEPGDYNIFVEILESNETYKVDGNVGMMGNNFQINRRSIIIKADPININVGDPLPEYTYEYLEKDLMEGDRIVSEPKLSCIISNTDTAGRYRIRVSEDGVTVLNSDGDDVSFYYSVEVRDAWLTVSEKEVIKKQVTLSVKANAKDKKTYDTTGFNGASIIDVKDGEDSVDDAIINIRYIGRGDTEYPISSVAPVNVGTYTIKARVDTSDDKYTSNELSIDIEIEKAAAPVLAEKVINVQSVDADTQKTLDITQCLPDGYSAVAYGTVTKVDESNVLTGTEQVDSDGILSYTLKADAAAGTAELTIPIEFKNYESANLTVKITLTSKTLLTLSQAAGVEVNKEYDGSAYTLPENVVTVSELQEGAAKPEFKYVYTYRGSTESVTALHAGQYTVTVTVDEDDENYAANDSLTINFEITKKTVNVTAKSGDWNKAFDTRPTATEYLPGYEPDSLIGSDNWTNGPTSYTYTYNVDGKETVLSDTDDAWNVLEAGTVITVTPAGAKATDDYEVVHISGKLTVKGLTEGEQMYVPDIAPMTYTGSQLKPQVKVYLIKNGEAIELTSKDYKVTYGENKNAGEGTVKIIGKGNYDKEITKSFTIEKASIGNGSENTALGITLKYTDQSLDTKASKLVTSLKYKKALKEGTDFTVTLTKADAPAGTEPVSKTEDTTPAKTPTGADNAGAYTLRIDAKSDNYSGYIVKTVYIAGKEKLLKNAKITLKKKSLKWDDKDTANYGNYDKSNWGGFYLVPGSSKTDVKDFIVTMGKDCLTNKQTSTAKDNESQYYISYTNNDQAGTATITVTGDGTNYIGTKSATFKIQGTAFKAGTKAGNIELPDTLTAPEAYTGKEITKGLSSLGIIGKSGEAGILTEGEDKDYTVTYNNNVKKGSATVIITANPKSGYTGSIKKSFKIQAADLKKAITDVIDGKDPENIIIIPETGGAEAGITKIVYDGHVPYSKSGATISGLVFKNEAGKALKPGTDYTVKYTYEKDKKVGTTAKMTLKGKGNYSGTLDVEFKIGKAAYSDLEVSVAPVKLGNKALKPKVTVKDGKKALTVSEDGNKEVKVTYTNNEPDKVQAWLTWLASGSSEGTEPAAPTVTIEIVNKDNYAQESPEEIKFNVYKDKLDKNKLTINWSDTAKTTDFTYNNGEQVKPEITDITYDNKTYEVKTDGKGCYAYDGNDEKIFKITYGANNKSGKKAGSVTIEGLKLYGGKYTEKFEISRKAISKN